MQLSYDKNGELKNGGYNRISKDKRIKYFVLFVDVILDGMFQEFYPESDIIRIEGYSLKGKLQGSYVFFYPNGEIHY